ncbi:uncharacterized protein DS421_14g464880 [Arachis hypogaea]|nr:uncharacterized protein DS421_14g464880 [Arachis hypogaea]
MCSSVRKGYVSGHVSAINGGVNVTQEGWRTLVTKLVSLTSSNQEFTLDINHTNGLTNVKATQFKLSQQVEQSPLRL